MSIAINSSKCVGCKRCIEACPGNLVPQKMAEAAMNKDYDTFVKLNRKILDWKWYQDGTTFRVFVHLILKANVFDNDFQNITVHRGQLVTSYGRIAGDLGFYKNGNINVEPIRTAIRHLKKTGEITTERIQKGLLITINNYEKYQGEVMQNSPENFSAPNENTMETQSERSL